MKTAWAAETELYEHLLLCYMVKVTNPRGELLLNERELEQHEAKVKRKFKIQKKFTTNFFI